MADAGYWRNDAIEARLGQGIAILIAPDADRRKEPRPGRRGGRYDFARRVLATDYGTEIYLKRQGSVEPVFGQIKANRGANRFLRCGRSAVRSEWRLLTLTHNILKLHRHRRYRLSPPAASPSHLLHSGRIEQVTPTATTPDARDLSATASARTSALFRPGNNVRSSSNGTPLRVASAFHCRGHTNAL